MIFCEENCTCENCTMARVEKEKAKAERDKRFRLAALKWLKKNPPPENWKGTKMQWAETEMPFGE